MTKYDYFDVNILIILWFWISAVSCLQEGKKTEGKYQGKVISIHFEHDAIYIFLRACLHGGGGPQVGEVTRLAVVEKWPAFTCKLTTPGSRGDFTRRCCVVARHVSRENGWRTTHFGGQCSFPRIICSRCNISVL